MSEYTPTTAEIRRALLSVASPTTEEFDRWLAAHDAEVRASVVTEEPEWEYGVKPYPGEDDVYPAGETAARLMARRGSEDGYQLMRRTKTISAGPWVLVEQGDET